MGVFAFGARLFAYTRGCPKRFVESALPYRLEFRETLLKSQIIAQSFSTLFLWLLKQNDLPMTTRNPSLSRCLLIRCSVIYHQPHVVLLSGNCDTKPDPICVPRIQQKLSPSMLQIHSLPQYLTTKTAALESRNNYNLE